MILLLLLLFFFFFNDTATTEIYTLSLHDALPIYQTFCKSTKEYSTVVVIGLLRNVSWFLGHKTPLTCYNWAVNLFQQVPHLHSSSLCSWLDERSCQAIKNQNLMLLWKNSNQEPMLTLSRIARYKSNFLFQEWSLSFKKFFSWLSPYSFLKTLPSKPFYTLALIRTFFCN